MQSQSLAGGFSDAPVEAALAFRAALEAMARPGTIHEIGGAQSPAPLSAVAATLILTLCDAETPLHLAPGHDSPEIRDWVTFHTRAPLVVRSEARFAIGGWQALAPLSDYAIGTAEYPDRSATLIVELDDLVAEGARLTGPGIRDTARLGLPEVAAFQANRALFPLGLDFFFTAGGRLAALPRTTRVEGA